MSAATEKIARLNRSIARAGDLVTLRRLSVDSTTGAESISAELADCPAHVRAFAPQDLDAGGSVADVRVVISSTQILAAVGSPPAAFGLPARDDRLVYQGSNYNIHRVQPIHFAGLLVRVNLLCRGGGG